MQQHYQQYGRTRLHRNLTVAYYIALLPYIRRPVRVVPDPIRGAPHLLIMTEVLSPNGEPHATNTRSQLAALINDKVKEEAPLFGFEQVSRSDEKGPDGHLGAELVPGLGWVGGGGLSFAVDGLIDRYASVTYGWPPSTARSKQVATFSGFAHERLVETNVAKLLASL